ncbi:lantibiotic dehydratase [Streptomyces sp. NRRL S-920]|uniref:lantibiotic dehydratase n=1 Tax=Streptomyces sp. NRRL S-920 TaxID=1463921 RepID=UPI0004C6636B|nr:lantibiotic dehydratase [Streptomyces sp. NRRL S-920]
MYESIDAVMVRAVAWPPDQQMQSWPDPAADAASWRTWIQQALCIPGFASALELASPVLVSRVQEISNGRALPETTIRKAGLAVMRYLLRASSRATPFGFFAGVAPARIADAPTARVGTAHQAVGKPTAAWLNAVIKRLEADAALRRQLTVQAHDLAVETDDYLVLEHRGGDSSSSSPARVQVRATVPVRAAMHAAHRPIRVDVLASKLAADFPHVPVGIIDKLLADMIAEGFLITDLRSPFTTVEPLTHLLDTLGAARAEDLAPVGATTAQLRDVADALARHNASPACGREQRAQLTSAMQNVASCPGPAFGVDLRLDAEVTIPHAVVTEAAGAATALVRLARRPFLSRAWANWHSRFLERYGPRALVPVLEAVDGDSGLGYPAGFLGGPPAAPSSPLDDRDTKLLVLAQNAALRRQHEIVLDDAMVADLAVADPCAPVQPTTEVAARVHASSIQALSDGEFTLSITGVSRAAGTMAGRFLHVLDSGDSERMAHAYRTAATATEDALPVQVCAPPLYVETENFARAPLVLPTVLPLGECRTCPGEKVIRLEDIAITADVHHLYLMSRGRRRPLDFVALNAVELTRRTHPLVRFLTEAPKAMSVPCAAFDWGAASRLPFLPAVRYRRTILSPARWLLTTTDLAEAHGPQWHRSLVQWQEQVSAPSVVYVGDGDQRIRLDLTEPAHRDLLRHQVQRDGAAVLRADTAADTGWLDGRAHEVVIPLAFNGEPRRAPRWAEGGGRSVGREHGHLPGYGGRFLVKLYGRPGRYGSILTRHVPDVLLELSDATRWWFLPYHDPDDHLRLRFAVPSAQAGEAAVTIGSWSRKLRRAGLISRVQWDTDFPETARFGGPGAIDAAEAYFQADSEAATAQLRSSAAPGGPATRALAAASMLDITTRMLGSPSTGMKWLIEHAQTTRTAPDRGLYDQAVALGNPNDRAVLAQHPGGEQIVAAWARRHERLATYQAALDRAGTTNTTTLLPELLHLHHTRIAGVDMEAESQCLHLARAAALSWAARNGHHS